MRRYKYNHRKALAKYGIYRCSECQGDGWITVGRDWDRLRDQECPECEGEGWNREEAFGVDRKVVNRYCADKARTL